MKTERTPYLPTFTEQLLKLLNEWHPSRPPDPNHSEREIWMRAGERRLVERLNELHQITQDENPDVHVNSQDPAANPAGSPANRAYSFNTGQRQ